MSHPTLLEGPDRRHVVARRGVSSLATCNRNDLLHLALGIGENGLWVFGSETDRFEHGVGPGDFR